MELEPENSHFLDPMYNCFKHQFKVLHENVVEIFANRFMLLLNFWAGALVHFTIKLDESLQFCVDYCI